MTLARPLPRRGLLCALAALLVVVGASASVAQSGSKKSNSMSKLHSRHSLTQKPIVLVFPPDTKGGISDQLSDVISDVETSRLQAGDYSAIYFLRALPGVQRAINDNTITIDDARPPYDSNTKVAKLAQLAGYKLLIVGAVTSYEYDPATKQINLTLSGRFIDVASSRPRILRSAVVPATAPVGDSEEATALELARTTAEKLMNELLKPVKSSATSGGAMSK